MKYLVTNVIYPSRGERIEIPDRDEILDRSEFLAFLDFMRDQGFRLVMESLTATDIEDIKEVVLKYELLDVANEETKGVD